MKLLLKNGWMEIHVNGSHHKLKKGNQTITIPVHGRDMDRGLLQAILKQTGLK
ncbi:MAG: type II toxin-antitoxin system HicA family toxin [Schwartzia sp.]|nr:type II toxin-antitoxin system HicA family toxin [Schwartzia sp. (in: firmicutes)]